MNGIINKYRLMVQDILIIKIGNCFPTDINYCQSNCKAEDKCPNHKNLSMLLLFGILSIEMDRMMIHGK